MARIGLGVLLSNEAVRPVTGSVLRTLAAANSGLLVRTEGPGAGAGADANGRVAEFSVSAGEALGNGASPSSLLPARCSGTQSTVKHDILFSDEGIAGLWKGSSSTRHSSPSYLAPVSLVLPARLRKGYQAHYTCKLCPISS